MGHECKMGFRQTPRVKKKERSVIPRASDASKKEKMKFGNVRKIKRHRGREGQTESTRVQANGHSLDSQWNTRYTIGKVSGG